jgi:hypothetical protein
MTSIRPLTFADLEVLEFARLGFPTIGHKEHAILERFGHSSTRFYQRLNVILEEPAADLYDPELVRRLKRIRDTRKASRTPGQAVPR